ncbi:MAG: TolC family protein [Thioalkalispiraceae bacterium]|jgi:outer membrane protein TolC
MRIFMTQTLWASVLFIAINTQLLAETNLRLSQAEKLAVERDVVLQMQQARSKAYLERSVADDTLPDPRIMVGLVNYPTDTFNRDQEPMTQTRIAVQQMFPRGESLEIKSRRTLKNSEASQAAALNRKRMVLLQTRSVYLDLFYWQRAEEVVKQNKQLFKQLVEITESQYASGIQRQQDVIRAELEHDMLDDRLDMIKTRQQQIESKLAKLIGPAIRQPSLGSQLPRLADIQLDGNIVSSIRHHPKLKIEDAKVSRSQYGIELARQSYKPAWMLEVAYGLRDGTNPDGSERADFASAMVSFDIPLFTKDKQDRQVAASQLNYQAASNAREETLRELVSDYEQTKASWLKLRERLQRYKKVILPQSRENASASLLAYQSRRGDFTSLMRARITELETELKFSRLETDLLKAQARLLYLVGETQ